MYIAAAKDEWKKMCERQDIDLIYIATPWSFIHRWRYYAMEHGKQRLSGSACSHNGGRMLAAGRNIRANKEALHDARKLLL